VDDQPTPTGSEGQPSEGAIPPLRESVSSAGERIQVIIEAAEKAAAGIIEDADAQAHRYIEASRERADVLADERVRVMSDLTDTLIRQAEMVKRQSDELLSALDSARNELANRIGQEMSTGSQSGANQPPPLGQPGEPARVPHLQPVESARPGLQAVAPAGEPQATPQPPPQPPPAPVQQQGSAPPPPPQPMSQPAAGGGTSASDGARLLAAQMAVAGSSRQEIEARLRDEFGIEDATPILDGILGPS
jgi:hypothetical protein